MALMVGLVTSRKRSQKACCSALKLRPMRALLPAMLGTLRSLRADATVTCMKTGTHVAMKLPQTGGCLCRKIRYEITEAPQAVYTCHCVDCQHLTSSAFSMAIVVRNAAFRLMGIEPRQIQSTADSGRVKIRWVCSECGCWVCSVGGWDSGTSRVRAGTLDDTSWLRPTIHFWTRSKQPWVTLPEGDRTFETQPEQLPTGSTK